VDCRYCHTGVEKSWFSNIPASSTCMNCHNQVLKDDPRLALVRESAASGKPVPWVQVHKVPDFVYFNHSVHVNRGISCVECHGKINEMPVVWHHEPQSMDWCLTCHRAPEEKLRPLNQITNLNWKPEDEPPGADGKPRTRRQIGEELKVAWNVNPPLTCAGCHR
jgi:hypothetical protein